MLVTSQSESLTHYTLTVDPATIRLYRGRANLMDLGLPFPVQIDGTDVGTIRPRQTMSFEVSPGGHRLRLLSWPGRGSGKREVSLVEGEIKDLLCFTNVFGVVDLRFPTEKDTTKLSEWFPRPQTW